jgi:hypothetical protein
MTLDAYRRRNIVKAMGVRRLKLPALLVLAFSLVLPSPAATKEISAEYERLARAFEADRQEFFKAHNAAKTDEERNKLTFPDREKYAAEMLALAQADPKNPAAVDPLVWVIQMDRQGSALRTKALEVIKNNHLEGERLDDICELLGSEEDTTATGFLSDIIARSPHQKVKGAAALALGQIHVRENPKEAQKFFNLVINQYGTAEQKQTAKNELFEMQSLAIGKLAPEIEGEDLDGKKFKLSDYRGKVVVLDFWGDW